jgi:hypothetical protein
MREAVNQKHEVYCCVVLCSVVVALYIATIRVYLHDVSLMLVRVEVLMEVREEYQDNTRGTRNVLSS